MELNSYQSELQQQVSLWAKVSVALSCVENKMPTDLQKAELTEDLKELRSFDLLEPVKSRFLMMPIFKGTEASGYLNQWWCSRRAVAESIRKLLHQGIAAKDIHVSLSHAQELSIAIAGAKLNGIGVDVEQVSRHLSEAVQKRMLTQDELRIGLTPIQIWTIKEACFKALPDNQGRVISDFKITHYLQNAGRVECIHSTLPQEIHFTLFHHPQWVTVIAKI